MRKGILVSLTATSLLVLGAAAQAGPAYKAADIVSHFATDLGPSRSLCIGTESECGKAVGSAPKSAGGFNLVVSFDNNSAALTKGARENLDEFARALKDPRLGASAFEIGGYTDAKGSPDYNLGLSAKRAEAVVGYLQTQGVDTSRLQARGYGRDNPLSGDPMNPANRRVETRIRTQ